MCASATMHLLHNSFVLDISDKGTVLWSFFMFVSRPDGSSILLAHLAECDYVLKYDACTTAASRRYQKEKRISKHFSPRLC